MAIFYKEKTERTNDSFTHSIHLLVYLNLCLNQKTYIYIYTYIYRINKYIIAIVLLTIAIAWCSLPMGFNGKGQL